MGSGQTGEGDPVGGSSAAPGSVPQEALPQPGDTGAGRPPTLARGSRSTPALGGVADEGLSADQVVAIRTDEGPLRLPCHPFHHEDAVVHSGQLCTAPCWKDGRMDTGVQLQREVLLPSGPWR